MAPSPLVTGIISEATARLGDLFAARDEVRIEVHPTRWQCRCGIVRAVKPLCTSNCGCAPDKHARITIEQRYYLEDILGDFHLWPADQQAAYLAGIALGGEIVRVCRKCEGPKHEGPCEDPR